MLKRLAVRIVFWAMVVMAGLNVELVTHAARADEWLGAVLRRGPEALYGLYLFAQQKWVLAIVSFYFGVAFNNWLTGHHGRITMRHGRVPLWWIRRRIRLVQRVIGNRTLTALADLGRELSSLDAELTSTGLGFPPLPTVDPHDAPGMELTKSYLATIRPFLRVSRLDHARLLASAVVRHRIV